MNHATHHEEADPTRVAHDAGRRVSALVRILCLGAVAMLAAACGQYGGGELSTTGAAGGNDAFAATSTISEADQIATFEQTLYPVLRDYTCTECHVSGQNNAPFNLADPNPTTAFRAVLDNNRVNLGSPGQSRLVARLIADNHHCWSDCSADGSQMLGAIQAWVSMMDDMGAGLEGGLDVGGEALASDSLTEFEGETDEGGERFERNLVAFWKFDEFDPAGSPSVAQDTSGVAPAIDLVLENDVDFMQAHGVAIAEGGRAIATREQSRKLWDEIADPSMGSGQYSVEAWVVPANTTQGSEISRIVTYSRSNGSRNFTLGQRLYSYVARNRSTSTETNNNGDPALETYDVDQDLQAALQHVVMTYDRNKGRRIYVDGFFTDDYDEQAAGPLWNWDRNHQLILGNELSNERQWLGQIRMLAIYKESLSPVAIRQNFEAGVGLRVKMNFDVSRWAGAGAIIEMSRTQIDDQSYLFCQPTLISQSPGIRVQNIRVRVNGVEPAAGQSFSTVSTIVSSDREVLSRGCAIVANPAGDDAFDLVFEVLGPYADEVDDPTYDPITYDYSGAVSRPIHGVRDFGRVNATMIELTGVDPFAPSIGARLGDNPGETLQDIYDALHQQLPDSFDVRSFVSSHQVGITKLGLEYCYAMVDDDAVRDAFFDVAPAFPFDAAPATAFVDATSIISPLVDKMIDPTDTNQPAALEMTMRLDSLITDLLADCGSTGTCTTREIVAGACTATLASATMTMH